ncbi:MAG: glycosidase, partial [Bacteroidales bacterium]|nr:glycosidase [Bacteroidales bacterium]
MDFEERLSWLRTAHQRLVERPNAPIEGNGVYERYENPVLTAEHAPLEWRYDLDKETNPYLMERLGIHAVLNAGAIRWQGRYLVVARVEGNDRKSFFAVAESPNGVDNFRFWPRPIPLPEWGEPATNV